MCNRPITVINSTPRASLSRLRGHARRGKMKRTILCLAGTVVVAACGQNAEPAESVKDLMAKKVQPTAEVYWGAVQFISDETGNHDIVPQTDADWERTRKAAEDLAGFGELLQTPAYTEGRSEDWTQFSQSLVEISEQAEKAAVDRSPDAVFEVGGTVYNVCSACHQAYPATTGPEATATGGSA